ncbi:MAG TPA: hypothetical protein VLZ53_11850, partial [Devosia sp.]|nr:hypothetical protein [Devosia sp.]
SGRPASSHKKYAVRRIVSATSVFLIIALPLISGAAPPPAVKHLVTPPAGQPVRDTSGGSSRLC